LDPFNEQFGSVALTDDVFPELMHLISRFFKRIVEFNDQLVDSQDVFEVHFSFSEPIIILFLLGMRSN